MPFQFEETELKTAKFELLDNVDRVLASPPTITDFESRDPLALIATLKPRSPNPPEPYSLSDRIKLLAGHRVEQIQGPQQILSALPYRSPIRAATQSQWLIHTFCSGGKMPI